ncbi:MAG TPA: hypothetical protein PLE54_04530 [Burkholderiaceae bacterium]|nr:hypothetical protein [Burkholderiaceae bacterium]
MKLLTRFLPLRWAASLDPKAVSDAVPPSPAPARMVPANRVLLSEDESRALSERRSGALRAMFPLLFSRSARPSDLWHAIVIERYLADAANVADLEQRIHELEQRRQSRWSL